MEHYSFMYSYANMPLQLGLAIVLCDITVMLLYAFHKVQVSDERIREKLGVTYVKTTEGQPQDQFVVKVNTRSMPCSYHG